MTNWSSATCKTPNSVSPISPSLVEVTNDNSLCPIESDSTVFTRAGVNTCKQFIPLFSAPNDALIDILKTVSRPAITPTAGAISPRTRSVICGAEYSNLKFFNTFAASGDRLSNSIWIWIKGRPLGAFINSPLLTFWTPLQNSKSGSTCRLRFPGSDWYSSLVRRTLSRSSGNKALKISRASRLFCGSFRSTSCPRVREPGRRSITIAPSSFHSTLLSNSLTRNITWGSEFNPVWTLTVTLDFVGSPIFSSSQKIRPNVAAGNGRGIDS